MSFRGSSFTVFEDAGDDAVGTTTLEGREIDESETTTTSSVKNAVHPWLIKNKSNDAKTEKIKICQQQHTSRRVLGDLELEKDTKFERDR